MLCNCYIHIALREKIVFLASKILADFHAYRATIVLVVTMMAYYIIVHGEISVVADIGAK